MAEDREAAPISVEAPAAGREAQAQEPEPAGPDVVAPAGVGVGHMAALMAAGGNQSMVELQRGEGLEPPPVRPFNAKDPKTKAEAIARWQRNRDEVEQVLREALMIAPRPGATHDDREVVLKNSAEWIDSGRADVELLTPTHDSHLRSELGAKDRAFFDARKKMRDGSPDYLERRPGGTPVLDDAIQIGNYRSAGQMTGNGKTLRFMDPRGRHDIEETLIHEVQHDADLHDEGEAHNHKQGVEGGGYEDEAANWVFNMYKSEVRAYWKNSVIKGGAREAPVQRLIRSRYSNGTETLDRSALTEFDNARQAEIFVALCGNKPANAEWFDYDNGSWLTTYGFVPHYFVWDPKFREMVHAYTTPQGGNLPNSIRLDALTAAIEDGGAERALLEALAALDAKDRGFLADRQRSDDFWSHAREALPAERIEEIAQVVDGARSGRQLLYARYPELRPDTEAPADGRIPTFEDDDEAAAPGGDSERAEKGSKGAGRILTFGDRRVTVRRGDSLEKIAARELGDAKRWRELAELNRDRVKGPDYVIQPGWKLQVPGDA